MGDRVCYARVQDFERILLEERPNIEALDADGLPKQGIGFASWSPDERFLATKHEAFPSAVWVWDLGRLTLSALLKHRAPVRSFAWEISSAPRGDRARLAVTTADPVLLIWSPSATYASPCPLALSRVRWQRKGRSLLLQERDRACICRLARAISEGPM